MVPSPRSTRRPSPPDAIFNQTWDARDAATFDPRALPVVKIPRGWERRAHVTKPTQGKEKTIWRRHSLRLHADRTPPTHHDDEPKPEDQDMPARAVKRRQQLSPCAMEKTAAVRNGKQRAFKATRWDRRKSVLPRKKLALALPDHESMLDSELVEDVSTENIVAPETIVQSVEIGVDPPAPTTPQVDDGPLDVGSPCKSGEAARVECDEEEFTEASLQLDIQRQCKEQSPPTEVHNQAKTPERIFDDPTTSSEHGRNTSQTLEIKDCEKVPHSPPNVVYDDILLQTSSTLSNCDPAKPRTDDITDGLTLSCTPGTPVPAGSAQRRLQSPPPPLRIEPALDDCTMTVAIDDDTAILKDFLTRAAASKAEKAATHRRESLQNRRDSDVVRNALASPRKVLEDKDPNSPSKCDGELTLDLSQTLTLSLPSNANISPTIDPVDGGTLPGSTRRSSRAKRSRLPALSSASVSSTTQSQTSRINIRRADCADLVVLKKSDVQELSALTRANTRKNKQGAFCVTVRLLRLAADSASLPPIEDAITEPVVGKNVRWDETLAYYQENPDTVAEAESLATPDELGMEVTLTPKTKSKISKSSTPKTRRVRTVNGTPGKGLLKSNPLLPETTQDSTEEPFAAAATAAVGASTLIPPPQHLPRLKTPRIKKMPVASTTAETRLPTLDVAPVGVQSSSRKSRLAAPKRVILPPSVPPVTATTITTTTSSTTTILPRLIDEKENTQRCGALGDVAALKKKGIPASRMGGSVPVVVESSGLPRRRGRKG